MINHVHAAQNIVGFRVLIFPAGVSSANILVQCMCGTRAIVLGSRAGGGKIQNW